LTAQAVCQALQVLYQALQVLCQALQVLCQALLPVQSTMPSALSSATASKVG